MSEKSDFEKRNHQPIFKRLGITDLQNSRFAANAAKQGTGASDFGGNGPCPEHPLGSDLFYVLRNAYRA